MSINDRLGGYDGEDIGPLGIGWYQDLMALDIEEAEAEKKRNRKRRPSSVPDYDELMDAFE